MRKDVLSQEMFPKRQLIRIVRDQQHQVTLDPTGKKNQDAGPMFALM